MAIASTIPTIAQLNEKYKGATFNPPTQAPVGPVRSAINAAGSGIKDTVSAATNFYSNLQSHLQSIGQNYGQNVGNAFLAGAQNIGSSISEAGQGKQSPVSAGLQTAGEFAKATFAPVTQAVGPVVNGTFNKLNSLVDVLSGRPQGFTSQNNAQQSTALTQKLQQATQSHPEAAKNIEAAVNVLMATLGEKGATETGANPILNEIPGKINDILSTTEPITSKPIVESTESVITKPGKISPEQQDIQNNIIQSQKDLQQAKSQSEFAAEQRKIATPQAVQGVKDINTKVGGNLKTLGENFGNDATQLEKSNPNMRLNLTNEQITALNQLKENKNFSLPEKIQQAQDAQAALPQSKFGNIKLDAKTQAEFAKAQGETQASLSPTEAQDLIKELNRSTFRQNADGSVTKDYQRVGITNEIKNAASQAFGDKWDAIYSKYSQGRGMIDKLDSLVNLDSKATPEDTNKQLEGILKQSKTPEGKLLLEQAVNEYKQSSGVDLHDPIKAIQQIADKQTALDEANSKLSDAQKVSAKAQRESDIAKLKQEQKMSTFKGRHPVLTMNAQYFAKRAAWGVTGGAVIGALGLSGLLKKVFSGK